MRILHLPYNYGGSASALARAERQIGLDSRSLAIPSRFAFPADVKLNITEQDGNLRALLKRLRSFLRVRGQYDIYTFNGGSSLLHLGWRPDRPDPLLRIFNQLDLPWYGKAKKFALFQGTETRQHYPHPDPRTSSEVYVEALYGDPRRSSAGDPYKARAIQKMSRFVEHMWAITPDLMHFLPKEKSSFLPHALKAEENHRVAPRLDGKLRLLHAPTSRVIKGTTHLLEAVEALQRAYPGRVELTLVEGLSHQEALHAYCQADLVVDQLIIGWYGSLSIEVMSMGKPVIARIEQRDLQFVPPAMVADLQESVIHATPETIYEVLERCLEDRPFLRSRAEASLDYVFRWHSPSYVAGLTKEKYCQ